MKREARQNYYRQMHTAAREIYEAGQTDEREHIISLLQSRFEQHTRLLQARPNRKDDDYHHTICRTLQTAIDLIKGETE
jgi:hypothetical protein